MNGALLGVTKQLSTAAGFLMANACVMADRETCGDQESLTMRKANAYCEHIEMAISFIHNQQEQIDSLMEANHRLEHEISEQANKIERLCARLDAYQTAEQEIPGR